ncbi:DUF2487 family protein [Bacillaceae bacterium S4-13-56]
MEKERTNENMLYQSHDLEQYYSAKEYIDTLLIPLLPISMKNENESKKTADQNELLTLFSNEIENQYKGRCLLTPPYTYFTGDLWNNEKERLLMWQQSFAPLPFKYFVFITSDHSWKLVEKFMDGYFVWFPSIPTKELQDQEVKKIIQTQVDEVSQFMKMIWKS